MNESNFTRIQPDSRASKVVIKHPKIGVLGSGNQATRGTIR